MSPDPDEKDVAAWMLERLERQRYLHQDAVVGEIERRFGDEFVYLNENGNPAISRSTLRAFRKLTEDKVVWDRGERLWRFREPYDPPGRGVD